MKTPKKPKRRFFTASQILTAIETYQSRMHKKLQEVEHYEVKIRECYRAGLMEDAHFAEKMRDKAQRSAIRYRDKKIAVLKQKLAEIQTGTLPGVGIDGSVEA